MRIITPPIDPVIPIEQLIADVRAPNVDGLTLERMAAEATQWVEERTQTALMTQTREVDFAGFPWRAFDLSLSRPVQSIVSIVYRDSLFASQTIVGANYYLQGDLVFPASAWPVGSQITIQFVAGYTSALLVPSPLKAAVRMKVQELYDGDNTSDAVNALLTNYLFIVA